MFDYDVLVIGSGFGGSVSALRLTEKGYKVGVLEAGQRFETRDYARSNWDSRRYLWFPKLGMRGIQRINLLRDVLVLSGAGVGGGSLVYANTLYEPLEPFYRDPQWAGITDWREELEPYYDLASRMLGVTITPQDTPADEVMRTVAERLGCAETFHPTPTGVYFGQAGVTVPDPYFGGEGPDRTGCKACGGCMVGCRYGAKNTLDKNYLFLAEKNGAEVHPDTEATGIEELDGGGWRISAETPGRWRTSSRRKREFTAEQVVVSAGVLGTLKLLFAMKESGRLSRISDRLGQLSRTNSEAILGATARDTRTDYSQGVAITSSIHPDEHTHIEPCRYPKGSNAMGLIATVLVDGGDGPPRWVRFLKEVVRRPLAFLRSLSVRHWSERTIILLVMQSLDNSLRIIRKKGIFGAYLTTSKAESNPMPTYIPVANEAARVTAEVIGGDPGSAWNEVLLDAPVTAHIIGGACIGDSPETGVIDPYQRIYGHDGLHVADGSAIGANLGVNPSLTITAMTERAMSFWPNKGEADKRPPIGSGYERIDPVAPNTPAVPASAPAALRETA
ncbi:MAG: cholesterol oxidase [Acidobacteria bacterium]|nr:MAG: cholesterol oxidase [Acidobacteriota bacterium]